MVELTLLDPIRQLGILCGLAFVPHSLAKFTSRAQVLAFFDEAGFKPAPFFLYFSLVLEIFVTACLVFGVLVPYAASVAAIFMGTAAVSVFKVSKGKWSWNLGGCEFHVFWSLCCVIVALHSF